MATKLSSITRTTYKSNVGDMDLNYFLSQNAGESLKNIYATLDKGGERLGNISKTANGEINVSLASSVSDENAVNVLSTFLADVKQITNELNE